MDDLADRLDRAADTLAAVGKRMPAPTGFGGSGPGLPGRLGRELQTHWTAVLDARSREAAGCATRLADAAQSVRTTLRHYSDTDELVRRRLAREV